MDPMVLAGISLLVGGLLNIAAACFVERLRGPRIKFEIEPVWEGQIMPGALDLRSLRVRVSNTPLGGFFGIFVIRAPALQCRGLITFHRLDGRNMFSGPMEARWASALQPNPIPIIDESGQVKLRILDPAMIGVGSRVDIYPGESEVLDVVARIQADVECYGWNNETYFSQPFGRNAKWKLPHERFLASVVIISSGRKRTGVFEVVNDGPRNMFRLQPATSAEQ